MTENKSNSTLGARVSEKDVSTAAVPNKRFKASTNTKNQDLDSKTKGSGGVQRTCHSQSFPVRDACCAVAIGGQKKVVPSVSLPSQKQRSSMVLCTPWLIEAQLYPGRAGITLFVFL